MKSLYNNQTILKFYQKAIYLLFLSCFFLEFYPGSKIIQFFQDL